MLGFDPDIDKDQIPLDFIFDDSDEKRALGTIKDELPELIFGIDRSGATPNTFEHLFSNVCNDTPATSSLLTSVLLELRDEKEIEILTSDGREKPRAQTVGWNDVIRPAKQGVLFSSLKKN